MSIDHLIALYGRWGSDCYDEELSQIDHGLQTAALAVAEGAPDVLVVAALLHDVGHLLAIERGESGPQADGTDLQHEQVGARFLAGLFPSAVTRPIALHVRAKRYRCTVDFSYRDSLSTGSRASLLIQGGALDAAGVEAFELHPGCDDAVRLRRWDDHGKIDGLVVPPLESYRPLLERVKR